MGNYSTRLGCTLTFNEESEKDVVRLVEQLQGSRKIGEFISHLLRMASENPEIIDRKMDGSVDFSATLREMSRLGVSPTRYQYLQAMGKEVDAMKQKIDAIYDMSFKMYMLSMFGKQIGLEKRSDNMLMSSFVAERELTKVCKTFGINTVQDAFTSNKLDREHEKANDALAYILETYDNIINEIKDSLLSEIKAKPLELEVVAKPVNLDIGVGAVTVQENTNKGLNESLEKDTEDSDKLRSEAEEASRNAVKAGMAPLELDDEDDDEPVDFSNAELGLLEGFFGE